MVTVTNGTLKGKSWLTKESQKFESLEKIRKFSTDFRRCLRNYAIKVEDPKNTKNNQITVNNGMNGSVSVCNTSAIRVLRSRVLRSKQREQEINIIQAKKVENSSIWNGRLRTRTPKVDSSILTTTVAKREQEKQEKRIIKAKVRQRAKGKKIRERKVNQIQDNGETMSYKEILANQIPLNVERPDNEFDEKMLHDIFSEADSDNFSDGEEFKAKYQQQYNDWDRSPKLKAALTRQESIDPDIIFERISPLNVEEAFKGLEYKLRPRTSSADWSGSDALTEIEELKYKEEMGYGKAESYKMYDNSLPDGKFTLQ